MPAVSKDQLAAMAAAMEGRSTLGIPPNVGADFVHATTNAKNLPQTKGKGDSAQHHPSPDKPTGRHLLKQGKRG